MSRHPASNDKLISESVQYACSEKAMYDITLCIYDNHLYAYGIARLRRGKVMCDARFWHLYAYGIARRHVLFLNIFMFHLYTYGITRHRRDE